MNLTMDKYTIYCTEDQTKKALELGAPIIRYINSLDAEQEYLVINDCYTKIPTAEQMISWLEEQIDNINVIKETNGTWLYLFYPTNSTNNKIESKYPSRKEATLAAIDAALEYLSKNK